MRSRILVAAVTVWAGLPGAAQATHAYRCDATEDPKVRQASCLPHQVWDSITGGRPANAVCAVEGVLGADNVKECGAAR